jgi:hypothetical protein
MPVVRGPDQYGVEILGVEDFLPVLRAAAAVPAETMKLRRERSFMMVLDEAGVISEDILD